MWLEVDESYCFTITQHAEKEMHIVLLRGLLSYVTPLYIANT